MSGSYFTRAWRALVLGTAFLALALPAYAQHDKADAAVRRALEEGRDLPVIVRFKDDAALKRVKNIKSGKLELKRTLRSLRAVSAKANHRALRELLEHGDVVGVSYDAPVTGNLLGLTTTTGVSVDSSASRLARQRYGVTGAGVNVAVIDSGVQPHTDLRASRIAAFVDFVNGRTTPYDDFGHGTHVAGIIGGTGAASSGQYTGVAPGAGIVALKVLDGTGRGRTADVIAALQWVLDNAAAYNVRVVNLSLGHPIFESAATDPLVQMVDAVNRRGIVVAVSAGNSGRNSLGQTVYGSITSPANAQGSIALGASDTKDTLLRSDDTIAPFSSRGPTRYDYYAKPDVIAPGFHIVSLLSPDSYLANKYPELKVGSSYFRLNGTSMAAPVAAGTAALLFSAQPQLTANTVKGALQFTAQRMKLHDVLTQGAGQVNVAGAVRLAKLILPETELGERWIRGNRKTVAVDLLFGEAVYWGRAVVWGTKLVPTNALYVSLAQWDDNIVWGMLDDNIVWAMDDNLVWAMNDDNIVWAMDDNLVWGMTDDNIVWGFDDSVSGGLFDDNIVWSMEDENIVWSMDDDVVMATSEELLGQSVDGESTMTEGGV